MKTVNFSSRIIRKKGRSNLRHWYNQATETELKEGRTWYEDAMIYTQELSKEFDVKGEICAGVLSALSPNNRWERNKIDARSVLNAVKNKVRSYDIRVCTYDANKEKAFEIAKGNQAILKRSPKTYAFARNVGMMDVSYVTIDKWHLRAIQSKSKSPKDLKTSCTYRQYHMLQEDCKAVAKEYNIPSYELQATVWVTIRNTWYRN